MLRNISFREKILLAIALLLIIGAVYYLKLYSPMTKKIADLNESIQTTQGEINRAKVITRRLPQIERELEEIEAELAFYHAMIPTEKEVTQFLRDLEALSNSLYLRFKIFRPEGTTAFDTYNQQEYKLSITGHFHNVILYITALEEFRRIVNIRDIVLSNADSIEKDWVELEINIVTYSLIAGEGGAI